MRTDAPTQPPPAADASTRAHIAARVEAFHREVEAAELQATDAGIARSLHLGCFGSVPHFERSGDRVQLTGQTPWPR